MRNNCNKIGFVALVIFMLIGTMNTWAQEVSLSSDMFHDWNYTDRKNVTMTNKDPYITNNIGIVLNRNEVIYGTAGMWSHNYADLTDYDCMRIIGDPNKTVKVQIVFNRKQDYGEDWVNETYTIAANGFLEINLPKLLSNYDYYHLNCIKFTNDQMNNGAKIQEIKLSKYEKIEIEKVNLTRYMFHKWNGVGADASYVTNDAGTAVDPGESWDMTPRQGGVIAGTGEVKKDVYADLMGYSAIYLEGTKNAYIRLVFNRWSDDDKDLVAIETRFDSNGKLLIDLKNHPDLKNQKFWHLNVIKSSWNNSSTGTITVSKIELWKSLEIGFPEKNDAINTQYSLSFEIGYNRQREFTFVNHSANSNTNNYGWALWATNRERTNDKRKDYFFMNLAPSIQMYDEESGALAEPEESSLYIKNGNDLETMSDAQMQQFRNDMANGCYVSVRVANYDGIITVYSVMKKNGRVYVYSTRYDKYKINNATNGAINVFFTVDHALLTNFRAKNDVSTRKVSVGGISYPTKTDERYKTCSVAITTLDGYDLPAGTAVGQGDTVTYHAIPGRKWEFVKWGNSGEYANPRNIVLENANINPYADFQRPANIAFFDPATDRVFFEDFENLDEPRVAKREIRDDKGNLIRTDVATNSGIEIVTEESDMAAYEATPERDNYHYQGKYLNYGGKGRVLNDPVFGKYYQNLADGTNEYTKSVAENFLRIILTDEQRDKIGSGICRYDEVWDHYKDEKDRSVTVGFWVNAKLANKYELPLERGSMFCMFSNERFRKADAGIDDDFQHPRFMFDLACNGTTYANMPNNFTKTGDNNQEIPVQRENFFFYGDTVPLTNTPTPSLFGEKFYKNAQDQTTSKFYDDGEWHYVAYVATNGLKTVTLFVDGKECDTMDMTTLGKGLKDFEDEGDFSGRTFYLRNIVLGGFTPHGLFFQKQYYEDAALAFDDIAIYSRALTADQIYDIIDSKAVNRKEWHFTEALKADGMSEKKLDVLDGFRWRKGSSDGIYVLNAQLNKSELEVGNNNTIFSTEGLKFTGATGQIIIDQKNGLIGLKRGAEIYVPDLNRGENVYFVVKSGDPEKYPLDPYDLWPFYDPCELRTRGVSLYGIQGKEDFSVFTGYKNNNQSSQSYGFRVYSHGTIAAYNTAYTGYPHNNNNNNNVLWISDVFISPYSLTYTDDNRKVNSINTKNYTRRVIHVDVERNDDKYEFTQPTLPQLIFTNGTSTKLDITKYTKANFDNGTNPCYIRFSSSAPHIANVNQSGKVTVTGITGYATIKAELVFDNLYDGCISTAYQIRVENTPKTHHVEKDVRYDVAERNTVRAKDGSDAITLTLGGWAYNDNTYAGTEGDVMDGNGSAIDSWSKGFVHNEGNDVTPVDGFSTYSQGNQNAKSESYGNADGSNDGRFDPKKSIRNVRPWTLPSRGSYLKFDAEKPGVLTVYVLQNGNLEKTDLNQDYSDQIHWRPVYVTDERGACLTNVQYDTNSKISENDNFFKEGRRRAQFIEEIEGTYNQRLKASLLEWRANNYDRFKLLLDHWENQGWKQKVIETGDRGYMIMSKGIVRYSFNVLPGQTYYVFSNDTKLGYAGYNFEEGKQLRADTLTTYDTRPLSDVSASVSETIVYKDKLQSEYSTSLPAELEKKYCVPIEYERNFTANTWSSICLPFSMNHKQLEENFGEGTSVVMLKKIHNSGALKGKIELIWHVNQDIIAGYPYFILPTKDVTKIEANVNYRKELEVPYLAVSSNGKSYAHKGDYKYYADYPYVFEGNFNDEEIPAGSYVMANNGNLTKVKKAVTAKPFRAYLRCLDAANAKPLTAMSLGDSEGETTSIEELLQDNGIILESSDVYGVNGLKVRGNTHSLEGLPKGVYVVKGKKYVVK